MITELPVRKSGPRSAPTLRTIAESEGVSISTVSLVLSGRGPELKISSSRISSILKTAEECGYRGNYHALALKSGKSMTLGIAFRTGLDHVVKHRFWGTVAAGIENYAHQAGYDLLMINSDRRSSHMKHALSYLQNQRVDAVVAMGSLSGDLPNGRAAKRLPLVLIDEIPHPSILTVNLDPAPGIVEATTHLHLLGHRELLWIGKKANGKSMGQERLRQFRAVCASKRMKLVEWEFDDKDDYLPLEIHLKRYRKALEKAPITKTKVTAVVCYNDSVALALLSILAENKVNVPNDVSVVGFDDLHAVFSFPTLTTISHSLERMGATAAELAIQRATGNLTSKKLLWKVAAHLVVRESTAISRVFSTQKAIIRKARRRHEP